jgi:hypothetical protein
MRRGRNIMTTVKYWQEDAACRGADPDELFAESTRQKRAKQRAAPSASTAWWKHSTTASSGVCGEA